MTGGPALPAGGPTRLIVGELFAGGDRWLWERAGSSDAW